MFTSELLSLAEEVTSPARYLSTTRAREEASAGVKIPSNRGINMAAVTDGRLDREKQDDHGNRQIATKKQSRHSRLPGASQWLAACSCGTAIVIGEARSAAPQPINSLARMWRAQGPQVR